MANPTYTMCSDCHFYKHYVSPCDKGHSIYSPCQVKCNDFEDKHDPDSMVTITKKEYDNLKKLEEKQ
jgi:hypothetical protein